MFFRKRQSDIFHDLDLGTKSLCDHTLAVGGSGSGKSSLLKVLLTDALRRTCQGRPIGCVWSCVKNDEADAAIRIISAASAEGRLLHLVPGQFTCNVLSYELNDRPGGSPITATILLERLNKLMTRSNGERGEAYWQNLFSRLLEYSITICWLAKRREVCLADVFCFCASTPSSFEQLSSEAFRNKSVCLKMLRQAEMNLVSDAERRQYELAATFICNELILIGSKGRGSALTQVMAILSPFMRSPLYETVNTPGPSSFTPGMALKGSCVVLDFPLLTHQTGGLLFTSLMNILVCEAALRQTDPSNLTLLVRDELPAILADPDFEVFVQSLARSHLLGFVSSGQSLAQFRAAMGGGADAAERLHAILANYSQKFLMATPCKDTAAYFSEAWGEHIEETVTVSERTEEIEKLNLMDIIFGSHFTYSVGESRVRRCPVEAFLSLRRGGGANRRLVDCFYTQAGRTFGRNGSPFRVYTFEQR
ncbi:AAA-like domain protein [Posidoniimonas corsicana]|uniref:AAA-like domain protein n=1 Tax=Posidoniimonas corsicana TaxID=1938618 RepID=A0A5C5VC19_9BACT|nr:TraM recognition domain-containing protein [Posidoniimonas corsicana]TWT35175.1 AAA-like domain protein [Posidoniimonas corsicana]